MMFAVITRNGRSIQTTGEKMDQIGREIVEAGDAILSVVPLAAGAGVVSAVPRAEETRTAVGESAPVARVVTLRAVAAPASALIVTVRCYREAFGLSALVTHDACMADFEKRTLAERAHYLAILRMAITAENLSPFHAEAFERAHDRLTEKESAKPANVAPGTVDAEARERVQRDRATLEAAGVTTADTVYAEGARVNETGVENARASRAAWLALPLVGEACANVAATVRAEERRDVMAIAASVKSDVGGGTRLGMNVEGRLIVEGDARRYDLSRTAMTQLIKRIGPDERRAGGAGYLAAVDPELRALNVNRLLAKAGATGEAPDEMCLRLRQRGGRDECFAIVSERYNALDIDRVAEIIGAELPESMRADVAYDGARLRVEALAHSDVAPEKYAAGETFKVGVTVRTDDTGRGGLRVDGIAVRNLCLNLIILDHASKPLARVTHLADADAIASALREGLLAATRLVKPFLAQWGMACGRNELALARDAYGKDLPMTIGEAIPGFYRALFNRNDTDRLLPVSPNKAIEGVMAAWQREPGETRAALANAITRWGHEREDADGFSLEDVATVANRILWARTDRALPWTGKDAA